jgi:hypothetical protein
MYALRHATNVPRFSPSLAFPSSPGMSSITFREPGTTLYTNTLAYPLETGRLCRGYPSVHGQACSSTTLMVVPAAGMCSVQRVDSLIPSTGSLPVSLMSAWLAGAWLLISLPPGLWICGPSGVGTSSSCCCMNRLSRSRMLFCKASCYSFILSYTTSCTRASTMASNDADFLVCLHLW